MAFIKKLEIKGFKSLGDKVVTLNFDKGLTVITGPNGSGKTNILDAILFAIGENSPKRLRVDKLTSLIYDGGPNGLYKPSNCKVTITFDNTARTIPIDSDLITISRELKNTGESVYYLNGKSIQKGNLSEILNVGLISTDGLNIVPQGMVTKIAELLPDQKRALIENIAGVAEFDQKKAEAMKQLQNADMKLQVAMARINEIKSRVNSLEEERNDQLRLKQLENEIQWLKAVLASKNLINTREKIDKQKQVIKECLIRLEEIQRKISDLKSNIQNLENERNQFISTVMEGPSGKQLEIEFEIVKITNELNSLNSDVENAQRIISRVDETLPNLQKTSENLLKDIEGSEQKIDQLKITLKDLEKAKKEAEKESVKIQNGIKRLKERISRLNKRLELLKQRLSKYDEIQRSINMKIEALRNNQNIINERLKALQDKSNSFSNTLNQLEANIKELENLKKNDIESMNRLNESISNLLKIKERLENEIESATTILEKVRGTVIKYDSQKSVVEQVLIEELGFQKLKELANAGLIDGFIDKFENLISYEHQYEKAVLAIGKKWMKSVIVKDINAMLKAAELIRRFKIGRLTIIPLSEISNTSKVNPPNIDGVIGVLADVIKVDKDFIGLVNFIFGDTILVDSTRSAYIVASRGFKSVSINGDVFEPKVMAFETGLIKRLSQIMGLIGDEKSFSTVKEALTSLKKLITKRKLDLQRLEKRSKELEKEMMKRALHMERLTADLINFSKLIKKYGKLKRVVDKKIAQTKTVLNRVEKRISKLENYQSFIIDRIKLCNKRILDLNLDKLKEELTSLEKKQSFYTEFINNTSIQIGELHTQLTKEIGNLNNNLQPSFNRVNKEIEQLKNEKEEKLRFLKESEIKIHELSNKLNALKSEEANIIESSKKSRPILESFEERLKILKSEEEELKKSLLNLERERINAEKSLDKLLEAERRFIDELSLLGYNAPIEVFDGADLILKQLNLEYEQLRHNVNLLADRSYKDVFINYKNLSLRKNQLEMERDAIVKFIESIEAEKKRVFLDAYSKIDRELRSIFTKLTGGKAWLEIENPDDIFSGGIFLMTEFLGKAPRESSSTSGGEKTVSALAFILAIQSVYPSPFYLFDEIDAHLDLVNSERLAELLKERARDCQIIIITLRESIMSRSSLIYGVYIENGISKVVKYKPSVEVIVKSG